MLLYKRSTGISMVQLWCEIASFSMVLVQKNMVIPWYLFCKKKGSMLKWSMQNFQWKGGVGGCQGVAMWFLKVYQVVDVIRILLSCRMLLCGC